MFAFLLIRVSREFHRAMVNVYRTLMLYFFHCASALLHRNRGALPVFVFSARFGLANEIHEGLSYVIRLAREAGGRVHVPGLLSCGIFPSPFCLGTR